MKCITAYGISTKTVPCSTRDSVLLSLKSIYLTGIKLDVYLTADKVLVVLNLSSLTLPSSFLPISKCPYYRLKNYNIGDKVRNHSIIALEDVLKIYQHSSKMLILNLPDHEDQNALFVDLINNLINKYPNPNIYIKSSYEEILIYLKDCKKVVKIGLLMNKDNINKWTDDYDFYVIDTDEVPVEFIKSRLLKKQIVMTKLIETSDQLEKYYHKYGNHIINAIYIITSFPKRILRSYHEIIKSTR